MFDTRLLTGVGVLAAVTEAGNFARAAELLGLTPSGVSRAVARLEARVGVRLFDRNPRDVSLTEEGRRFHARVMPLLAGLDEAAAEAAGAAAAVRGRLRVSVDPWFARMVLASRLQQFLARYPQLSIDFSTSNYREEMMAGADVAVRFGPPDASSLIVRKLLETHILTVAAPAYLERHGEPRSPHDLIHHEALLFRDPRTGLPFPWEFRRGGEIGPGHFPEPLRRPRGLPVAGRARTGPARMVGRALSAPCLPPFAPSPTGEGQSLPGFYPGDRQGLEPGRFQSRK
jgi:DNA-binding transcriptional LysR family regulator